MFSMIPFTPNYGKHRISCYEERQPPTRALFDENVCKNERIGSVGPPGWGGVGGGGGGVVRGRWKLLYVDLPSIKIIALAKQDVGLKVINTRRFCSYRGGFFLTESL